MKWFPALLALALLMTACASQEESDVDEADKAMDGTSSTAGLKGALDSQPGTINTRARTERRLQLQRSLDQWYYANERQEYGKVDGLESALSQFVTQHEDEIIADLGHQNPRWRKISAAGLGFGGSADVVAPLMKSLRDPEAPVVIGALLSLSILGKGGVELPSTDLAPYLSHPEADVRSNAALVLTYATKPGQGELFLPLTGALEDSDPVVRVHVAAALGALGDKDAVPFLSRSLQDAKALVRIRSAYALARIGDRRGVDPLIEVLDDPVVDVQRAAHKSLKRLTGEDLPRDREVWHKFWESQARSG